MKIKNNNGRKLGIIINIYVGWAKLYTLFSQRLDGNQLDMADNWTTLTQLTDKFSMLI